jgi:hypothetical protein
MWIDDKASCESWSVSKDQLQEVLRLEPWFQNETSWLILENVQKAKVKFGKLQGQSRPVFFGIEAGFSQ